MASKFYTLASASDDKTILLWSPLSSDTPIAPSPLTGHSNYVYSLAFSPKGNMLVSGSYDEAVFLWDVRSGRAMRQLPAHSDPVGGVDFICDGTMACSCSTDGLIRIWDSGTGQCLRTLVDEARKGVTGVMFAPNGGYLLAWTLDGCVRLWDFVGGRCVKTYQGHVNKEFSLGGAVGTYYPVAVYEERGRQGQAAFVASGSEDGNIVIWDVTTKETLWRGEGAHRDVVLSVDHCTPHAVEGARGLLVSVGKDRDVRIWVEDVADDAVRRRQARLSALKKQQHRSQINGNSNGYAVDEDEDDINAQMMEMEGDGGHDGMDVDHHEVNGHDEMEE
jgi:COMPASS component SWD3